VVVVAGAPTPALAANVAFTPNPIVGQLGATTTVTASATGLLTGVTTPTARFIPNATGTTTCPTTAGNASATSLASGTVTKTNDNEGTVVAPATLGPGAYRICIYNGTLTTAALEGTANALFTVTPAAPTLSPGAGPSAGGNALTLTSTNAYLTSATTIAAVFTTAGTCPATYTTGTGNIAATATKTSTTVATVTAPAGLTLGAAYGVCIYNGSTGTSVLLGRSATTYGTLPALALSPTVGPSGGTNSITATAASAVLSGVSAPAVTFSEATCAGTYTTGTGISVSATVTKISNSKVAILVPAGVALDTGETVEDYNVCVYAGNTGTDALLSAPGTYRIAPTLTVTSILPAGGPAQGGSRVTINGGGFPFPADDDTILSVSIGGSPLEDIEVVSASIIRGTTTAHAPGDATVSVTTEAGTKTLVDAFEFSYGISVEPNTAPSDTSVYLDILGVGFQGLTFGTGNPTTAGDARVFLVNDEYDGAEDGVTTGSYDNPPVAECTGVLKISDNEIICSLNLANSLNADGTTATGTEVDNGTYTVAVVSDSELDATLDASDVSIISSGSTFTVSPY
jgi:hypothetical protein